MENHFVDKEIRNFYEEVRKSRITTKSNTVYCRKLDGTIIGDSRGRLERWTDHFGNLLKEENRESISATVETQVNMV